MSSPCTCSLHELGNGCFMLMIGVPSLFLTAACFTSLGWYGLPLFCGLVVCLIFLPYPQQTAKPASSPTRPPLPSLTYLAAPSPTEPIFTIQAGQIITVPTPHTLQVIVPEGLHLEILEATPERIRVIAV